MLVNSLDIREFRGIKRCQFPIEFSEFTILIGRNNSGKSTILEALSLLPHPEVRDVIFGRRKEKLVRELHPGTSKRIYYLYAGDSRLDYRIADKPFKIEISNDQFKSSIRDTYISKSEIAKHIGIEEKFLEGSVIFFPDSHNLLNELEIRIEQLKDRLMKKQIHIKLTKILNQFGNDDFSEIVFLEPISLRKVYSNEKTVYLRLSELGSGAEKVIKMMAILEAYSPSLVIFDDFESGLHPSLIRIFLKWLNERNFQKIISTHSIDVLYQLVEVNPPNTSVLQLSKSNEDILNYKKLKLEEIEDLLDSNSDPRLLLDNLDL